MTGPATLTLTPPPLGLGGGRAGAAAGHLFPGVFGAEARARHLDEVGPMGKPIKRGGRQQGLAEELRPLSPVPVRGQQNGGLFIAFVDDVVEVLGAGRAEGFEPEVIELCGAPHNAEHF